MPEDELVAKKTSPAEQTALAGTQGKKKFITLLLLWKKGQPTQEAYKDIVRLGREKMRSAKVQLNLMWLLQ